jgi:hypothetical protein
MEAMSGKSDVVECAFVENNLTSAPFFSSKVSRNMYIHIITTKAD